MPHAEKIKTVPDNDDVGNMMNTAEPMNIGSRIDNAGIIYAQHISSFLFSSLHTSVVVLIVLCFGVKYVCAVCTLCEFLYI